MNRDPQPRDMMIRSKNDFSLPLQKMKQDCVTQASHRGDEMDRLTVGTKREFCLTQKSYSKRSLGDKSQAVIAGGVRRTRQQEEHRLKIISKPANFEFRDKYEEEKAKKNFEVRSRTSKLMALIKTKNTLLNVKADITDFKTKVDN